MKNIHPYFRKVFRHILIWILAFAFFTFLREYGQKVEDGLAERLSSLEYIAFQIMIGTIAGILFGSYAYFIEKFLTRKFSFGRTVLISSLGYILVIMTLVLIGFGLTSSLIDSSLSRDDLERFFENGNHRVLIVFCFIVGFLIEFIQEVDRKFGPGNLWKMLKGKYYQPIEEERALMFLDMRSSTTIAEKLGHIKYSRLVQDCFKDISVIADHGGHIYQYVGDEAVLTWEVYNGFDANKCVNAYFAFCDQLQSRKDHYISNYGLLPEFKAGMNIGPITTAEVGDIKREIAFHGDTINTAARIQSMCNTYGQDLLASEAVVNEFRSSANVKVQLIDKIILKGKNEEVGIHAIQRN